MVQKRNNIPPGSLAAETRKSLENGIDETNVTNTEVNMEPIQKLAQMAQGKSDDVMNGYHGIQTNISDRMYVRMLTAKANTRMTFKDIIITSLDFYLKSLGI